MMLVAKKDKNSAGDTSLQHAHKGTAFSPEHEKVRRVALNSQRAPLLFSNSLATWRPGLQYAHPGYPVTGCDCRNQFNREFYFWTYLPHSFSFL
jgi:hypothetical protein